MSYEIRVYKRVYAPWKEHQDEPTLIVEDDETHRFDHLVEVRDFLVDSGFMYFSSDPSWYTLTDHSAMRYVWLYDEPYIDQYAGNRYEHTACSKNMSDREWSAVLRSVDKIWKS